MKKKGFTLVELLAVIALLSLITGIVVIYAMDLFNTRSEIDYENIKKIVIENTKTMIEENPQFADSIDANIRDNSGDSRACIIDYQTLVDKRLIDSDIINPKTNKTLSGHIIVRISSEYKYLFDFKETLEYEEEQLPNCLWPYNTIYVVSFDLNGGTSVQIDPVEVKYGTNIPQTTGTPTRIGYTFIGWNTQADGSGKNYSASTAYTSTTNETLYAQWRKNKVNIRFHVNGGTLNTNNTTVSTSNSLVTLKGDINYYSVDYGGSVNLANYNNSDYVNILNTGYHGKANEEWNTNATGTGISYNQGTDYTNVGTDGTASTHFCDARNGDCTVILYVNWVGNKVNVKFHVNGGTLNTNNSTISTSGSIITRNGSEIYDTYDYGSSTSDAGLANWNNTSYINVQKLGKEGKESAQWNTQSNGSGTSYNQDDVLTNLGTSSTKLCDARYNDCTVTLYVNWVTTKVNVRFHVNGGTLSTSNNRIGVSSSLITLDGSTNYHSVDYGGGVNLANYNNSDWVNIVKTGYTGKSGAQWNTQSNGSGTSYNQDTDYTNLGTDATASTHFCDARYKSCTVTLYVNWVK